MIGALGFLTIFGRARVPGPKDAGWFPFVGFLLGLGLGGVWVGANEWWPPMVAAAIVVAVDLAITGMLHLDGLADGADGLLPHMERERRLEVLREPTVGAFGVGVVVVVLLLRVAALASMEPRALVLCPVWAASRLVMAAAIALVPYARADGGLASAFVGRRGDALVGAVGVALTALFATREFGAGAGVAVVAALVAGAAVVALGRARLGGYTGDVLGAAGMIAETVGLLVLSATW